MWNEYDQKEEYGLDELKNEIMEGVSLDEISKKDIKWCERQWHLMMALTYASMLSDEVLKDRECYYGNLMIALEKRIKALGGKVISMQSIEIPEHQPKRGWTHSILKRVRYVFGRICHILA